MRRTFNEINHSINEEVIARYGRTYGRQVMAGITFLITGIYYLNIYLNIV